MRERAGRAAVCLALLSAGCVARPTGAHAPPRLDRSELTDAGAISKDQLAFWTRAPRHELRQSLTIAIADGVSGRGFEGRGVVVVRPGHALRMILLGPGGTTAMDVWMSEGAFRVAIPALDRIVRGDGSTPKERLRGLPIGLLSRWLVSPFGGTLIAAHAGRIDGLGHVHEDDAVGPGGARSFVAFSRREGVFEARTREVSPHALTARAWWFHEGKITAFLEGEERALGEGNDAPIVPIAARYVSLDPPMTVEVTATETTRVQASELPEATFADPDAP